MLNGPSTKDTSIKRTSLLVPMVSIIVRGSTVIILQSVLHNTSCTVLIFSLVNSRASSGIDIPTSRDSFKGSNIHSYTLCVTLVSIMIKASRTFNLQNHNNALQKVDLVNNCVVSSVLAGLKADLQYDIGLT